MAQRQTVNQLMDQQGKIAKAQNQLATGKRIQNPSDDPTGAARTLVLEREVARTDQFDRNGTIGELKLTREEEILGNITNVLQNTRELAVQALNGTYSVSQRQMMASEAIQNFHSLMSLMNTQGDSGAYIFGGYDNDHPPFNYTNTVTGDEVVPFSDDDTGAGNKVFNYLGDNGQTRMQLSDSVDIPVNDPGDTVFMDLPTASGGEQSVLDTLYQFGRDLQNDSLDGDLLTNIDNAIDQIDITRSQVGARLNAIEDQHESNADYKLFVETNISGIQDIDMAEAITDFNMQLTVMQAIQQTYTKTSNLSLFNYL